jgi:NTP pyrophosphatase (non-canonical NTP hydrolase)
LVAGALKHWKRRRDAGAPAAVLVGIVGEAAEGVRERKAKCRYEREQLHAC